MSRLFAEPMESMLGTTNCQYCDKPHTHFDAVSYSFGVHACDDHKPLAQRDAKAWMHKKGLVRWRDAIKDPLFTQAEDLLFSNILVRRTNGAIEGDWTLCKPWVALGEPMAVKRSERSGEWSMTAIQDVTESMRGILVKDLKLSLIEEEHYLVDAFIGRLDAGFYKEDAEADAEQQE